MTRSLYAGRRTAQAGLTLIELMVVVAIIGVLMVAASTTIDRDPDSEDVGQQIANLIREASRKAIAAGPLPAKFADEHGPDAQARARLRIFTDAGSDNTQVVLLERVPALTDDADIVAWDPFDDEQWDLIGYRLIEKSNIVIAGWSPGAALTAGGAPVNPLTSSDEVSVWCYANGQCDGVTLYLENSDTPEDQSRIVIMPLSGAPLVYSNW